MRNEKSVTCAYEVIKHINVVTVDCFGFIIFPVLCLVLASSFSLALFLVICSYDKFSIHLHLAEIHILKTKIVLKN